jgi:hypothetical protein
MQSRFPKSADIDPALAILEDRGWIRRKHTKSGPQGGRPSEVFEVYPEHAEST